MIDIADLLFIHSKSIIGEMIEHITISPWSHVELITQVISPEVFEVISADAEGVTLRNEYPNTYPDWHVLTLPVLSQHERQEIICHARTQIGKPYDVSGLLSFLVGVDLDAKDKWFCSELTFWSYLKAGIELLKRVDKAFISPRDLFLSPILETAFSPKGFIGRSYK